MIPLVDHQSQRQHASASQPRQHYDVCIVGAGPAGLACLSALREPFSLDSLSEEQITRAVRSLHLHQKQNVCVIDPHFRWMEAWRTNFETLDIEYLRSPALAHPNAFDQNALLAYAMEHNRMDELIESGCSKLKHLLPLGQSQIGLWQLPSTKLFMDFAMATLRPLQHDYIVGSVTDVFKNDTALDGPFHVTLLSSKDHEPCIITADAVILAIGVSGVPPTVSQTLKHCPLAVQWQQLDAVLMDAKKMKRDQHFLAIGGGLTAAQTALKILNHNSEHGNTSVVLCSRRRLKERHFDIGVEWFDRRTATKCMFDFYHQPVEERLDALRETKDGGSIPPIYMQQLDQMKEAGRLQCVVGVPKYVENENTKDGKACFQIKLQDDGCNSKEHCIDDQSWVDYFDGVVVACGTKPDCLQNKLLQAIWDRWPVEIVQGFPTVSEDLQWTDKLFCIGSLGALNVGPDAGNLMGIRRAAQTIANSLKCRGWLRERALVNPFDALYDDDSSSDGEDHDNDDDGVISTSESSENNADNY